MMSKLLLLMRAFVDDVRFRRRRGRGVRAAGRAGRGKSSAGILPALQAWQVRARSAQREGFEAPENVRIEFCHGPVRARRILRPPEESG